MKNLFTQWGQGQKQTPPHDATLKETILSSVVHNETVLIKKSNNNRLWWLTLASVPLAACLVVFMNYNSFYPKATSYESVTIGSPMYGISDGGTARAPSAVDFGIHDVSAGLEEKSLLGKVSNSMIAPDYWYGGGAPTAEDARELLKTYYGAHIRTRHVDTLGMRLQTMIRGYGGRVDSAYIQTKSGSISFVLPKSSFETFKTELKSILPERFVEENLNVQNMLPQKQNIEEQTDVTKENLESYQTKRKTLVDTHNAHVVSLQAQINAYGRSISTLNNEVTTSTVRQQEIKTQVSSLEAKQRVVKQQLIRENEQYKMDLQYVDADIEAMNRQLVNLGKQDQHLVKDVETVNGTISLEWISLFQIVDLYVPVYGTLITIFSIIILGYLLFGRRRGFDENWVK